MQVRLQDHQKWDLIAFALALVSFPICLLPIRIIVRDTQQSSRRQQRIGYGGLLSLWIVMATSHLILIAYPIVGVFETVCDDGLPATLDTVDELRPCKRNYIGTLVEAIEVLSLPVYPTLMVSTYMQLLPTSARKRVLLVARLVKGTLGCLTLAYFTIMVIQRLDSFTRAAVHIELSSSQLLWKLDVPNMLFFVWFFAMVAIGVLALVLTLRLLPHLDLSQFRTTSPSHSQGGAASPSKAASGLLRFTMRSSPGQDLTPTVEATRSATTQAAVRVQACVRRLRGLVGAMVSLLLLCSLMVIFDWFPRVMYVTVGWVSGRALTVTLFVATREIRNAVIARRSVPANAVGVTLAATAWSGQGRTLGPE